MIPLLNQGDALQLNFNQLDILFERVGRSPKLIAIHSPEVDVRGGFVQPHRHPNI